jgi:hypothetical protein
MRGVRLLDVLVQDHEGHAALSQRARQTRAGRPRAYDHHIGLRGQASTTSIHWLSVKLLRCNTRLAYGVVTLPCVTGDDRVAGADAYGHVVAP